MKKGNKDEYVSFTKIFSFSNFIKFLAITSCTIGFLIISWQLFKDFSSGSTIVSSNYVKMTADETLQSPSVLICNQTGFKSSKISTNLEDYLNETLDAKDLFYDLGFMNQDNRPLTMEKIRSIYTPYKGRCYVFEPAVRVTIFNYYIHDHIIKVKFFLDLDLLRY